MTTNGLDKDELWKKIQVSAHGSVSDKIFAVDKIFENFDTYPPAFSLIKHLASKTESKEVRLRVALKMRSAPLVVSEYFELLKILSEDGDVDIFKVTLRQFNALSPSLFQSSLPTILGYKGMGSAIDLLGGLKGFQSALQQQTKALQELTKNIGYKGMGSAIDLLGGPKGFQSALQQQTKALQELTKNIGYKSTKIPIERSATKNDYSPSVKLYASILDVNKILTLPIKNELNKSIGFYSQNELEPLKSPPQLPKKTTANKMLVKLQECKPGREHWNLYQDVCKEILGYCLVPPLSEPIEQLETRDGLHIRDIIFRIPHELQAFWTWIINKFGIALVVECKNYKNPIKENQLLISSKYIGEGKLTILGLLITRKGLHKNGVKAQENLWKEQKKMIVCLDDENLQKMLQLKEEGDEPWKVIDHLIFKFLSSSS